MSNAVRMLTPFEYNADFAPQEAATEKVKLAPEEVVALITKVRADTLEEVTRQKSQDTLERLDTAATKLRAALGDLTDLMSMIDKAGCTTLVEDNLRGAVDRLAMRLLDGQGDLFAAAGDLSARLDKSPGDGAKSVS